MKIVDQRIFIRITLWFVIH